MNKWQNTNKFKVINTLLDILGILLIVSLIITTFIFWKNAPDTIPTHYNLKGEIDAYGSKNSIFILLPIVVTIFIGLFFLGRYPQIYNYAVQITPQNKEKQYNMQRVPF